MALSTYLDRYSYPQTFITSVPAPDLGIIVTIPCYNEPSLHEALESLGNCKKPQCSVEVIIVINCAEDASDSIRSQNLRSLERATAWAEGNSRSWLEVHLILIDNMPAKQAGVGLARKIAMDEAVRRFESLGNRQGIITGFDADCTCDENYFRAIENYFISNSKSPGASIHFEHPMSGDEDQNIYAGIIGYELHLRYYVNALRATGHPSSFQTVGSSMAVTSWAYQKQGGMNKRKAGEDFYFLQKIIALGNYGEITDTVVFPSPRPSDRVPFGTGKAINNWLQSTDSEYLTYNPSLFWELSNFIKLIPNFYDASESQIKTYLKRLHPITQRFLEEKHVFKEINISRANAASIETFIKRSFQWFDGLKVLQFIHYGTDEGFPKVSAKEAVLDLFPGQFPDCEKDPRSLLLAMRKADRARLNVPGQLLP